ncbi:MAG: hypothetical protein ACE5KK_00675 [Candidatus Brocadiales bacterium]
MMDRYLAQLSEAYKGFGIKVQKQCIPGMITITVTNPESGPSLLAFHRFCQTSEEAEKARNELVGEARRYIDNT